MLPALISGDAMKKIIDGALYNTDTARMVGRAATGESGTEETLYRTKAGKYFMHCDGIVAAGGGWLRASAAIVPLTPEQALAWAEANLPAETCRAECGATDPALDKGMYIKISQAARDKLERLKSETNVPFNVIIDRAIIDYELE